MQDKLENVLHSGFRYALSLTGKKQQAEDLVHDAWIKLHKSKKRVNKKLFLIAIRHLFIDQYRRQKFIVLDGQKELKKLNSPDDFRLDLDYDTEQIEAALQTLRVEEREAILLNVVEGYSTKEIAKITDRPRSTILSLIYRGKQKLADTLTKLDETAPGVEKGSRHARNQ